MENQIIIYGAGLIASEFCRYLKRQTEPYEICCFAVTCPNGNEEKLQGYPVLGIDEAIRLYSGASIYVAVQEKYHKDVLKTLQERNCIPKEVYGLHRMTDILRHQAIREINEYCSDWQASEDKNDYSMVSIVSRKEPWKVFKFYPMTQVPISDQELARMHETVNGGFEEMAGIYPKEISGKSLSKNQSIFIAMACSEKDAPVSDVALPSYVHPVVGGAILSKHIRQEGKFYDDTGKNISSENPYYSELSVAYWLWKNIEADYVGLCHYRRHFVLEQKVLSAIQGGEIDIVLTRPRLTLPDVRTYFSEYPVTSMTVEDYAWMMEVIRERNAEWADPAEKFFSGQIHLPDNMVIARREIYGDYCQWMFDILKEIKERRKNAGKQEPLRCSGYMGELLTTFYFMHRCKEDKTIYVDYALLA